jgi:hypothetical protein
MTFVTLIYVLLLLVGTIWAVYRIIYFLRSQREREAMWDQMMSPEEIKAYVENLKQESASKGNDTEPDSADEQKTS